ncbi:sensor histidine kinase [Paenibacillus agricola]|uniref:Sensor histidine kinase n=1 Tax=Paenibacillus agricola TaxID=2716264 RepID=A0ABX0JFR4_9BACL|nr:sensor histidine kinase [Paenibacillus agricola]NHN35390.1 sensor histidine kinase [Paenibacillus agricola]
MAQSNSFPMLIRTKESDRERDTLSLIRTLNAFPDMNLQLKILKIDMQLDAFTSIFKQSTMNGNVYLLSDKGEIIFTTDPSVNWSVESVQFNKLKVPQHSIIIERDYRNITYLNDWKIVGVFPETSVIEEINKSREFFLYLTLANFLAPTLLILLISRSLHTRLITLLKHMKKVKNQNFELIVSNRHNDEVGQLTEEFNRMTMKIKLLIEDVYVAGIQKQNLELQRKQAQLNALQSQINPHFLFNALETIRMRSLIKNETETAKIIKNMAKIFRKSLTWGKDWVTIEEEMDLIMCFLEIQKYRFGDKLAFDIHVEQEAYRYKIPKMCFLPFVENASIHGLESIQGKGLVELHIHHSNEMLTFLLRDNGIGIPQDKLNGILSHLQDEDIGESIGIKNVFIRLKLYYGDNFQFTIESIAGTGTAVRISIPCRK